MLLSCFVVFVTTYMLILPAISLDRSSAETEAGIEISGLDDGNLLDLSGAENLSGNGEFPAETQVSDQEEALLYSETSETGSETEEECIVEGQSETDQLETDQIDADLSGMEQVETDQIEADQSAEALIPDESPAAEVMQTDSDLSEQTVGLSGDGVYLTGVQEVSGSNYTVSVDVPETAQIPAEAVLVADEITDVEYDICSTQALEVLGFRVYLMHDSSVYGSRRRRKAAGLRFSRRTQSMWSSIRETSRLKTKI